MRPLRLLAITNRYPPEARGGYGEICADVMSGLAARGHEVAVLSCGDADAEERIDGVRCDARASTTSSPRGAGPPRACGR